MAFESFDERVAEFTHRANRIAEVCRNEPLIGFSYRRLEHATGFRPALDRKGWNGELLLLLLEDRNVYRIDTEAAIPTVNQRKPGRYFLVYVPSRATEESSLERSCTSVQAKEMSKLGIKWGEGHVSALVADELIWSHYHSIG